MKKAFTLVELMVVVAILALLSVGSFIYFGGYMKDARNGVRQNTVSDIITNISAAYATVGKYPTCATNPCDFTPVTGGLTDPATDKLATLFKEDPKDPRSTTAAPVYFLYWSDADGANFAVEAVLEGADTTTCTAFVKGSFKAGSITDLPDTEDPVDCDTGVSPTT